MSLMGIDPTFITTCSLHAFEYLDPVFNTEFPFQVFGKTIRPTFNLYNTTIHVF